MSDEERIERTSSAFVKDEIQNAEGCHDWRHIARVWKKDITIAASTIRHFFEKLLLLKDWMNTETGRKMAELRHRFMEIYLYQFYREWDGAD